MTGSACQGRVRGWFGTSGQDPPVDGPQQKGAGIRLYRVGPCPRATCQTARMVNSRLARFTS